MYQSQMTLVKTFNPLLKKGGQEGNEWILTAYLHLLVVAHVLCQLLPT